MKSKHYSPTGKSKWLKKNVLILQVGPDYQETQLRHLLLHSVGGKDWFLFFIFSLETDWKMAQWKKEAKGKTDD